MPNGQYISPTAWHQLYANGIVIKDIRHKLFTGWMEPPVLMEPPLGAPASRPPVLPAQPTAIDAL